MADTQEPQGTVSPAEIELDAHEQQAQDDSFYGGEAQPTGGDSTTTQAPPPPTGNPLARWLGNIGRGVADGANQLLKTGTHMMAAVGRAEASMLRSPAAKAFTSRVPMLDRAREGAANELDIPTSFADRVEYASEEEISTVYGAKPKDVVGGLLHGISQFATGAAILTPVVGPGAAMFASGGAAFDPKEGGIGNILAQHEAGLRKMPVAGAVLANAGKALAVDESMGPLEARMWNAVGGELFGRTTMFLLKPLFKGATLGWKAAFTREASDVVEVVAQADGTFAVQAADDLRFMPEEALGKELDEITAQSAVAKELSEGVKPAGSAYHPETIAKRQERGQLIRDELDRRRATEVPESTVDVMKKVKELGLEEEVRAEAAMRGGSAADAEHAARTVLHERLNRSSIKAIYADEAAARSDAATVNAVAHDASRGTSMFTPEEVSLHNMTADALRAGDVGALNGSNPHFNLQSMNMSADVDAQVNALTTQFTDLFSVAQGRPGVPNEVLHKAAENWASEIKLDNFLNAMKAADAAGKVDLSIKAALYNAATKQAGQEVAELAALMAAKPGDEALEFLARRRLETFLRVSESTANFNSELGRGLQALSARGNESANAIKFGVGMADGALPVRPSIAGPRVEPPLPFDPQRLSPAQLGSLIRLFGRSGGDVRVVAHVREAFRKGTIENKIKWEKMSDFNKNVDQLVRLYINSVIAGFKTVQTVAFSGAVLNGYHASMKVLAGAKGVNGGLVEEGVAQWYALARYSRENMRGAWAAFKENRGILESTPPYNVDPSKIMGAVQVPGRTLGSLDEFTRQAAYRADEFATAFRSARDEGLTLADAVRRAEFDVSTSIDKETGMGLNSVVLKRAGIPTLSDNPGMDNLVGRLSNVLAEYPATKFIVPFVRPSVNTFRYAHMSTPILNRWSRDAQAIYQKGGEALSVLHMQSKVTGAMMVYAMSKWMDGEITGAGPKDPALRAMLPNGWQPYSIKIGGGKYHSYRRVEPFATFLGLVADGIEIYHEIPDEDRDEITEKVQGAMTAVFAAATRNTTSKSWTESVLNFFSAMDDKDEAAMNKYVRGVVRGLIPFSSAIKQFNDDPAWREVHSVMDEVRNTIPGWSETLPAKHSWDGTVKARQGDMWNRNLSAAPSSTGMEKGSVDDILISNFIRLSPPNPRPYKGIDMWDERWRNKAGKLPYQVFMDKLAATGVRAKVAEMVKSDAFTNAPKGNRSYPESLRGDLVQRIVGGQQLVALHQMLAEFGGQGGFAEAYNRAKYVIPVKAKYEGQEAANAEKELYGIPTNITR